MDKIPSFKKSITPIISSGLQNLKIIDKDKKYFP
jgi:hypothetical protein